MLAVLSLLVFACAQVAQAQTTYSVIKVTASLPCAAQSANGINLVKVTLTTKDIINIALDQPVTTVVPKEVILGFAGDFDDFGHTSPNTAGPMQLVVFNTNTMTKLKTIGVASNGAAVENRIVNKYLRVFNGLLTIQDTGGATTRFLSGQLVIGGAAKRSPNDFVTAATLKVSATVNVVGQVSATFFKNGVNQGGGIIARGSFKASGKVLGTFTE